MTIFLQFFEKLENTKSVPTNVVCFWSPPRGVIFDHFLTPRFDPDRGISISKLCPYARSAYVFERTQTPLSRFRVWNHYFLRYCIFQDTFRKKNHAYLAFLAIFLCKTRFCANFFSQKIRNMRFVAPDRSRADSKPRIRRGFHAGSTPCQTLLKMIKFY